MKSITGTLALLALAVLSSTTEAHQTAPSRSRSHHAHLASSLAKKTTLAKRATPSGWTSQGCVTEGTSGRVLTGYSQQGVGSLTVESCLATCASMAYAYGGVECEFNPLSLKSAERVDGSLDGHVRREMVVVVRVAKGVAI